MNKPPAAEDVLQKELARRIALCIRAHPGLTLSEVRERTGKPSWNSYASCVNQLEDVNVIRSQRKGRFRLLYPLNVENVGVNPPVQRPRGSRDLVARALLGSCHAETARSLAVLAGLQPAVVRRQARALAAQGLVLVIQSKVDGRSLTFLPTNALVALYKDELPG